MARAATIALALPALALATLSGAQAAPLSTNLDSYVLFATGNGKLFSAADRRADARDPWER